MNLQFSAFQPAALQPEAWNRAIASLPDPHVLQTWEWAQVKARFGWEPTFCIWSAEHAARGEQKIIQGDPPRAAALLLQRTVSPGGFAARLRVLYVPKGPLLDWQDTPLRSRVLDDLSALARRRGAIFLKIDPDVRLGVGAPGAAGSQEFDLGSVVIEDLSRRGWRYSPDQIQFRNTAVIDLSPSEAELLASMKQKTRYNLRLAERRGVHIRTGSEGDFPRLYRMYAETAVRDGFTIRDEGYYRAVWETFLRAGLMDPLVAEVDGEPVAATLIFRFASRAYYLYGMSRELHREKMPNALLQWEAIRRARAAGCRQYDLWGAPETFSESDPLWGVYRFKEGLGGQVVRTLGAWDLPTRPLLYRLYTQTLPHLLDLMRSRAHSQARKLAGA